MLLKLAVFVCAPLTIIGVTTLIPENANSAPPSVYIANSDYALSGTDSVSRFQLAAGGFLDTKLDVATGRTPTSITPSFDGHNLYITNANGDTVSQIPVNPDGTLSVQKTYQTQNAPSGAALSPDGRNLYVTNMNSASVSRFPINSDGTLGARTDTMTGGRGPIGIAVSPDGRNLYIANSFTHNGSWFSVNSDGTLGTSTIFATESRPEGVLISPDGRNLYVTNSASASVSRFPVSPGGLLGTRTDTRTGNNPHSIIVSLDGRNIYTANINSNTVSRFSVNPDGTLSGMKSDTGTGQSPYGVAATPDGHNLYTVNFVASTVSRFSVSSSGTLGTRTDTPIEVSAITRPFAVAVSPVVGLVARFVSVVGDGGSVGFDGSSSSVSGANVVGYHWDFGDGTAEVNSSGPRVDHVFHTPGTYTVRLTVVDDSGCPAGKMIFTGQTALCNRLADEPTTTQTITISQPQTPPISQRVETVIPINSQCVVPSVTKLSLGQAKKKLVAAKCQTGKVSKPKKRRHKRGYKLLVVSQSRKQGTTLPGKTKIGLKLGWVKPKKQR